MNSSARNNRVCVVDDNHDAADSLAMVLQTRHYDVHVAYNGIDGLASIFLRRPAVAILDLGMPGLSGFDVAAQVRATFGTDIALIALSGWGHADAVQRAMLAGFTTHITKPADPCKLANLVAQYADRAQERAS